jgi:iron-sulfur cluster assembly accessory protein
MSTFPITISTSAWDKMTHILSKSNKSAFVFFASGGGCNGFNYKLESIDEKKFNNLTAEQPSPIIVTNSNTQVVIEPMSEMLLLGTNIDFIEEDYSKNIFESRFIFTPEKDFATSCGCGISFSPK